MRKREWYQIVPFLPLSKFICICIWYFQPQYAQTEKNSIPKCCIDVFGISSILCCQEMVNCQHCYICTRGIYALMLYFCMYHKCIHYSFFIPVNCLPVRCLPGHCVYLALVITPFAGGNVSLMCLLLIYLFMQWTL